MFTCGKCRGALYVQRAEIKGSNFRFHLICRNHHRDRRDIPFTQINTIASDVLDSVFVCSECGILMGVDSVDIRKRIEEYTFVCPNHGVIMKDFPIEFHTRLNELREAITSSQDLLASMTCSHCGQMIIIEAVGEKQGIREMKGVCVNGHRSIRYLSRGQNESTLKQLLRHALYCDQCGLPSGIVEIKEKEPYSRVYISCPIHGRRKRVVHIAYLKLLVKVAEEISEDEVVDQVLSCKECQHPLSIRKADLERTSYKLKCSCINGHNYEMDFPLEWSKDSTQQVTNALLKCNECNLVTQILNHKVSGSWTEIELVCPIHGTMKKGVSTEVYKRFEELEPHIDRRKSIESSLTCVKCNTALSIRNARLRRDLVELDAKCREDHSDKRYYIPNLNHELLVTIYQNLYECAKCHEIVDLEEITEHLDDDDEFKLTVSCRKHGHTQMSLPHGHEAAVRDAYLSQADLLKLKKIMDSQLDQKVSCEFSMADGVEADDMYQLVRSVIHEHDVRFISENISETGTSEAWYYGRTIDGGEEYVIIGSSSASDR